LGILGFGLPRLYFASMFRFYTAVFHHRLIFLAAVFRFGIVFVWPAPECLDIVSLLLFSSVLAGMVGIFLLCHYGCVFREFWFGIMLNYAVLCFLCLPILYSPPSFSLFPSSFAFASVIMLFPHPISIAGCFMRRD
jgi:hypothetical protein